MIICCELTPSRREVGQHGIRLSAAQALTTDQYYAMWVFFKLAQVLPHILHAEVISAALQNQSLNSSTECREHPLGI